MAYTDLSMNYVTNHAGYLVTKISNGYTLQCGMDTTFYKTKKQVAAAIVKHLTKEVG